MANRPVVFVPGFPASHLKRASDGDIVFFDLSALLFDRTAILPLLLGPDDLSDRSVVPAHPIGSGANVLGLDVAKKAQSLYDVLRSLDYETEQPSPLFRAVGWDWRKPVDDSLVRSNLREAILTLEHDGGRKPVALVHSTGGLVLRATLEKDPELATHLDSVIAFGVPWGGTLRTLPLLLGREGFGPVSDGETQRVMTASWAAFDLLPPASANAALKLVVDPQGHPVDPLAAPRAWFAPAFAATMNRRADASQVLHGNRKPGLELGGTRLKVTNVVGFGSETLLGATLHPDGRVEGLSEATDDAALDDGDGTVPRRSAAWLGGPDVRTYELPLGFYPGHHLSSLHDSLWKNPGGQDLLWSLLADEPWRPFVHFAFDDGDVNGFADHLRLRLAAFDSDGAPLPNVAVEFRGLSGGTQVTKVAESGGRALFSVPRRGIRKTTDGRFRRLTVAVRWQGGAIEDRAFLLPV